MISAIRPSAYPKNLLGHLGIDVEIGDLALLADRGNTTTFGEKVNIF